MNRFRLSRILARKELFSFTKQCYSEYFEHVKMGPPDVILGITEAFLKDKDKNKVNLGVGAYRDDNNKPFVLKCVRQAEERIMKKNMNHEYAPIAGDKEFGTQCVMLALGDDSEVVCNELNATVQGVSGTGSLRIGMQFLANHYCPKVIYISKPTWGNHKALAAAAGLTVKEYTYYDPKTIGFNIKQCLKDISEMEEGGIILLHACAHNPTGVDPTREQWEQMSDAIKKRKLHPFFDMAYQGFATGDVDNDAFAVRYFVCQGHIISLAQSFAKNMGLYGERAGAYSIFTDSKKEAEIIMSQLKIIIRTLYSSPPIHGSRIVLEVLKDPGLKCLWLEEVKIMADRIMKCRKDLKSNLEKLGSKKNWDHIVNQIGMFTYTGLNAKQVEEITKKYHIYFTKDGRISMAGLTSKNVEYVAKAIHEVTKK